MFNTIQTQPIPPNKCPTQQKRIPDRTIPSINGQKTWYHQFINSWSISTSLFMLEKQKVKAPPINWWWLGDSFSIPSSVNIEDLSRNHGGCRGWNQSIGDRQGRVGVSNVRFLFFGHQLIHYPNMSGAIIYKLTECAVQCHKPARFW